MPKRIFLMAMLAAVAAGLVSVMSVVPVVAQEAASASRSFDSASVDPGGQLVVTITASGYGQAGGVTETLPAGFSYVSSSLDAAQVTELGSSEVRFTLQGDTSFTYTVTASSTPGSYTFSGTLRDADRGDHTVGGSTSVTVNTTPAGTTPSASRSFDSAAVSPGDQLVVTITASDYGQAGGVTETLPAGFSYVSSSLDASQVNASGQTVRFTLQGDASFTYTVTASSTPGSYTFSGTLRDADRGDHTVGGATDVTVQGPSAKRAFSSSSVSPGATVTVTIAAAHYGQAGAVTETIPAGFSYVSSSLDASQVDASGQTVRFTLQGQGDASFTYTVTAPSELGTYTFSGTLRDVMRDDYTVGGATRVRVRNPVDAFFNRLPAFGEGDSASRSVAENSAPGTAVGDPVTATDADRDRLAYRLSSGADGELFVIDSGNGQISVGPGAELDFETTASYTVSVEARDPSGARDTISITITVDNVDEDGAVTLSPVQPQVGAELAATLADPDGSISDVSWSWERSSDGTAWTAIAGADSSAYTPVEADQGHHLRATVEYTDGHGSNKTAQRAFGDPVPDAEPEAGPQSVNIDVTVWRSVRTGNIFVSTRPEGEGWTTHNTPIDLSNLSASGRFYQGLPVALEVDHGGEQSVNIDVTVWRSVRTGNIFVSTRPEGEGWTTHNTPIDLSNLSASGRFYQGLPVTVEVDLE